MQEYRVCSQHYILGTSASLLVTSALLVVTSASLVVTRSYSYLFIIRIVHSPSLDGRHVRHARSHGQKRPP